MSRIRTCVGKDAKFVVGIHRPEFEVKNLRANDHLESIGKLEDGSIIDNSVNFPENDLYESQADTIYEIANAFPFRGTTYINSAWADPKAGHPEKIFIPPPEPCSFLQNFKKMGKDEAGEQKDKKSILNILPHALLIALAQASTDPEELMLLAQKSCRIIFDPDDQNPGKPPVYIGYTKDKSGKITPDIYDHALFDVLVNNRYLPDDYKNVLVLKPGVQGNNEITGEYLSEDRKTHVFEYLRRNSYIPWGHFASNMANDAIRYRVCDLSVEDMKGIRHLYYQRAFVRVASQLDMNPSDKRDRLSRNELEALRVKIEAELKQNPELTLEFDASLWGWNFGFGYAQSGHRLHASHQMIHQQNAMIPKSVQTDSGKSMTSFACGDLIRDFIKIYKKKRGKNFFTDYFNAVKNNTRTDGNPEGEASLVVMEDDYTILFVPKAQICEWELQLMPKISCANILQADINMRNSLDRAVLFAVKILESLGAQFVTSIEYSSRFESGESGQQMLYSFIPRLPHAPDTFSEAQLRRVTGVYPEDFAHACRERLTKLSRENSK